MGGSHEDESDAPAASARDWVDHLDEETVLDLLHAALSDESRRRVERHLEGCGYCRELVAALAAYVTNATLPTSQSSAPGEGWGPSRFRVGSLVGGRFRLEQLIGSGGMGRVFRARDEASGAMVAVKAELMSLDPDLGARFEREAQILSELEHPAIVRYVAHGTSPDGQVYLAMEWLDGQDLGEHLARSEMLASDAVLLARRVADGLAVAHGRGIVHRDIKPGNIFLPRGRVEDAKIIDFGIARFRHVGSAATRTGVLLGTPGFMAPEQARRSRDVDARADIFSLGCVLYQCLTGARAFAGDDLLEVLAKILLETPRPPSALSDGLSEQLDAYVLSMLAKDPAARPPSCEVVSAGLATIDALRPRGAPVRARSGSRSRSRRLVVAAAAAAAAACCVALGAVGVRALARRSNARTAAPSATRPLVVESGSRCTVLVLGVDNQTSDPILDGTIDIVLANAIDRSLLCASVGGAPLRRFATELRPSAPPVDEQLGRLLLVRDGGTVVTVRGTIAPSKPGYALTMTATDARTGTLVLRESREAGEDARVVPTVGLLAYALRRRLGERLPNDAAMAEQTGLSPSLDADHEFMVGRGLAGAGKAAAAMSHLQRAVALDPRFTDGHRALGLMLSDAGRDADAVKEFELGLESIDLLGEPARRRFLASYYDRAGDLDRAIPAFRSALEERPDDFVLGLNFSITLVSHREFEAALVLAHRLAKEHPTSVVAQANVVTFEFLASHLEASAREAETLFRDFTNAPAPGYVYAALASFLLGDEPHALATYAKLETVDPSLYFSSMADLAAAQGRLVDAAAILERGIAGDAVKKDEESAARKWALLSDVRLRRGDDVGARAAAEKALVAGGLTARYLAGETLIALHQEKQARIIANGLAVEISPDARIFGKILEASLLRRAGKAAGSIPILVSARGISDSWLGHYALGLAYFDLGQLTDAEREFRYCVSRRGEAADVLAENDPTVRYIPRVTYDLARTLNALHRADARSAFETFLAFRKHADRDPLVEDAQKRLALIAR